MSYGIEYKGDVYKIPRELEQSSEDDYLLVITQGDNNVYEATGRGRGRRSRDEYIVKCGWNYLIIGEICKRAGECEGGSLQVPGGKWITPESYLKRYRTKIKNAQDIKEFFKQGKRARFELKKLGPEDWGLDYLTEFKDYIHEETNHYSKEVENWCEVDLVNYEEFKKFSKLWGISRFPEICLVPSYNEFETESEELVEEVNEKPINQLNLEVFGGMENE